MQVAYNGFTGELVKLEREDLRAFGMKDRVYNLSIYDSEKQVTHSFAGVKQEDMKFSGGCERCGCVFVARKMEYEGVSQMEWLDHHVSFKCKCPTCENMVYQ